jgi:hypothetical protein
VLKIKNIATHPLNITPAAKGLFICIILLVFSSFDHLKHPFYISVIDIKHNAKTHDLNISVKLFTNDIESALQKK